jgi:uncharacterized protein YbbK (DUF523 family)
VYPTFLGEWYIIVHVMAVLDKAIHAFEPSCGFKKNVDGRVKHGHDDVGGYTHAALP